MTKPTDSPDIVDVQQAAAILGIARQSVYTLMREPGFPPAAKLTRGFAWHRGAIEEYARRRNS